eukprot:Rhum_TRINITY_DN15154_c1_g1::Rhum_TRINITY_DN15154_c1_g1_i1::g.140950::m.140950
MDVSGLRRRLNPRARKRFDEVWQTAFPVVPPGAPSSSRRRSLFRVALADTLVECCVARRVGSGGPMVNVPFTVGEEKESGPRQRHPVKEANEGAPAAGFVADIPPGHVSEYLDVVSQEYGSTRDFKTGFYAVSIPVGARHLCRFQDDGDRSWSACRWATRARPRSCTLCASAAGDPTYVTAE